MLPIVLLVELKYSFLP